MNTEILHISERIKEAHAGDPWFGRNASELLSEVEPAFAFEQPNGQHSIIELVWHMCIWKEFTINRIRKDESKPLSYFEKNDWKELPEGLDADEMASVWHQALKDLEQLHVELVDVIQQQKDDLLLERVKERNYDFRKLLNGILEHDVYHLGQIAYLKKVFVRET